MEPEWVEDPSLQYENAHSDDELFRKGKNPNRSGRKQGRLPVDTGAVGSPFSKILVRVSQYKKCFFHLVTACTCLLALLVGVANCYTVYRSIKGDDELEVQEDIIRVFAVVFSVFVIVAELEIKVFMRYFTFMYRWMARGLVYAFIGVISYNAEVEFKPGYGAFNAVCAGMMVVVGVLYFLLGLSCMKTVKEVEARTRHQSGSMDNESEEEF